MHADNPAAVLLAETLLREWETSTHPIPTPAYLAARPRVLALLTEFSQSLLIDFPINVDAEDVRSVVRRATTIGLGTAVAHAPGRAGQTAALVIADAQAQPLGPVPTGRAVSSLLCIISGPDCDLEMDELTEITETIQTTFGQDMEIIFGHDILPDLTGSTLQVWLLVGFGDTVTSSQTTRPTISAPPNGTVGDDVAFDEAAYLAVRYQDASSSFLQRELKISYARTQRILKQFAQVGVAN